MLLGLLARLTGKVTACIFVGKLLIRLYKVYYMWRAVTAFTLMCAAKYIPSTTLGNHETECCICLEKNNKAALYLPCLHSNTCLFCTFRMDIRGILCCPVCRSQVQSVLFLRIINGDKLPRQR